MSTTRTLRKVARGGVGCLLMFFMGGMFGNAIGGELRPYELPSQRSAPYQQQAPLYQQQEQPPITGLPAPRSSAEENLYETFRGQVQALSQPDRERLATALRENLQQAYQNRMTKEAMHYERLLGILYDIH